MSPSTARGSPNRKSADGRWVKDPHVAGSDGLTASHWMLRPFAMDGGLSLSAFTVGSRPAHESERDALGVSLHRGRSRISARGVRRLLLLGGRTNIIWMGAPRRDTRCTRIARALGAAGILLVIGNLATTGCDALTCSGTCRGNVQCYMYSKSGCPVDVGCTIVPSCRCDLPDQGTRIQFCDPKGPDCSAGDASMKCGAIPGCVWRPTCTGLVNYCARFGDQATCESYDTCAWDRNCG